MKLIKKEFTIIIVLLLAISSCTHLPNNHNKDLAQLHLRLGTGNLERGAYPEALKDLLTAETYDPNDPLIQNNLGLTYYMREKFDLAENHLRKSIKLEPNFTDAKNNLSRVLIEKNNTQEAKEILKVVLDDLTYPMPWKAQINLGLANFKENNFAEAKDNFLKAINIERENCLAENYYARTLMELKDYKHAITAFEKAETFCLRNQFDEPSFYSAVNYYRMGDSYKAKLKFEALIEKGSSFKEKAEQMLELLRK